MPSLLEKQASDNPPYFAAFLADCPARFRSAPQISPLSGKKFPPTIFTNFPENRPSFCVVIQSSRLFPAMVICSIHSHKIFNNFSLQQVIHIIHIVFHIGFFQTSQSIPRYFPNFCRRRGPCFPQLCLARLLYIMTFYEVIHDFPGFPEGIPLHACIPAESPPAIRRRAPSIFPAWRRRSGCCPPGLPPGIRSTPESRS